MLASAPLVAQQGDVHRDVPYVPTPPDVVAAMLKLGDVKKGDVLFDLGCGDGRIVIMAAQKFGATGTGVDIDRSALRKRRTMRGRRG
jgi:methylase of polypeptide subunit release factors